MEQVCRALALACRRFLRRRRGTSETQCLVELLQYHQQRNAASRRSNPLHGGNTGSCKRWGELGRCNTTGNSAAPL